MQAILSHHIVNFSKFMLDGFHIGYYNKHTVTNGRCKETTSQKIALLYEGFSCRRDFIMNMHVFYFK